MSFLGGGAAPIAGVGVYTLEQAATLVRLRYATVDAIVGPRPTESTTSRAFPLAIAGDEFGFGEQVMTFQDLMELRVAAELHRAGVPWPTIRLAAFQTRKVLQTDYPLTSGEFRTDGRRVFLSLKEHKGKLPRTAIDLRNRQQVFEDVIEKSLSPTIVVRGQDGRILKWYPLGKRVDVVLDPSRRFGEPVDPATGVPTASLAEAYHAENGNLSAAADWFGTSRKAVRDAVLFEQWLGHR